MLGTFVPSIPHLNSATFLGDFTLNIITNDAISLNYTKCSTLHLIELSLDPAVHLSEFSHGPAVLGNYKPISNLPFISKVLERAVNERMLVHLQTNGLMPKHQSAYRRGHSTETALLKVTSDALLAADQGMLTLLGMLDLSTAFDCVDHDILLNRLEKSFGFFGMAIRRIRSYITGRRQYVRYSGSMSTVTPMLFRVPQGSELSQLLFVFYVEESMRT